MVLNRTLFALAGVISLLQVACNRTPLPPNMAIAHDALKEYCKSQEIAVDIFTAPHVYRETNEYDWCVEFITKTNSARKHVLLLYFKENQIVERQRTLEPEP
jgi:hypothetical protein